MNIPDKEKLRLSKLWHFEREAQARGYQHVVGVDEAGRGPLAGPVATAACILPPNFAIAGINDSKKIPEKKRERLYQEIIDTPDLIYKVVLINVDDIDTLNIYQATQKGIKIALKDLYQADYALIDGMAIPSLSLPHKKIIRGDSKSISIATASILAKVTRDRFMRKIHEEYPMYQFTQHKGYGTSAHLAALHKYGPCKYHRKSFKPVSCLESLV